MQSQKELLLPSELYEHFKADLGECDWFTSPHRTLFVLALGSHVSATFDAISRNPEIEIVWRGSYLPWWARPFGLIAAAYGGIVRVGGTQGLGIVCDNLLQMGAIELLVVERSHAPAIRDKLAMQGRKADALSLAAEPTPGIIGTIFIDDDADSDYPIIYQFADGVSCPLLAKYEQASRKANQSSSAKDSASLPRTPNDQ